jgi:site-specific DNA recombinase
MEYLLPAGVCADLQRQVHHRLAGAGPHPNPAKAAQGKQLHRLEPDPITAPTVRRIFTEYAAGRGMTSIARGLSNDGIACPSAYDRKRNPHRRNAVWETTAVRAILLNPRYTGRQVWNKQRTDEVLIDVEDISLGHENKHRWNDPSAWVWSADIVHTPLISTTLFEQAQSTIKIRGTHGEAGRARRRTTRSYLFRGLLRCGLCGRMMTGNPNHGRNYYRCQASRDYVHQHGIDHPPVLYLREDAIADPVDVFLHQELAGSSLPANLRTLAQAQHRAVAEEAGITDQEQLKLTLAECDAKLAQYRAALDAGGDPTVIVGWISETTAVRTATQARRNAKQTAVERMSEGQISMIIDSLGGLLQLLRQADPRDKAEIYSRLGLQLTYHPGSETLIAEVVSPAIAGVNNVCPRADVHRMPARSRWWGSGQWMPVIDPWATGTTIGYGRWRCR